MIEFSYIIDRKGRTWQASHSGRWRLLRAPGPDIRGVTTEQLMEHFGPCRAVCPSQAVADDGCPVISPPLNSTPTDLRTLADQLNHDTPAAGVRQAIQLILRKLADAAENSEETD